MGIQGYKKLVEVTTPKGLNQLNQMLQILFAGGNFSDSIGSAAVSGLNSWTTAQRPAVATPGKVFGFNMDYQAIEFYTNSGWFVNGGTWTTATRPTSVVPGSWGYNTTILSREYWDGSIWNAA
jgi:hypothetical protein